MFYFLKYFSSEVLGETLPNSIFWIDLGNHLNCCKGFKSNTSSITNFPLLSILEISPPALPGLVPFGPFKSVVKISVDGFPLPALLNNSLWAFIFSVGILSGLYLKVPSLFAI